MSYNDKDNLYYGYIYKIANKINDKVYIGQTTQTIKERWREHIKYSKKSDLYLYRSMRKYGIDNFNISQIEECVADSRKNLVKILNDKEVHYIAKFNSLIPNGYNIQKGGNNREDMVKKSVDQYDLKGNYLNTFNSLTEAALEVYDNKGQITKISDCCYGNLRYTHGYVWRFHGDPLDKFDYNGNNLYSKVDKYSLDGVLLKSYNSMTDAFKDIPHKGNVVSFMGVIIDCCKNILNTAYGYVWRYHGEPFNKFGEKEFNHLKRKVQQYDKYNNFVCEYELASDASRKYGGTYRKILSACKSGDIYLNYYWHFKLL